MTRSPQPRAIVPRNRTIVLWIRLLACGLALGWLACPGNARAQTAADPTTATSAETTAPDTDDSVSGDSAAGDSATGDVAADSSATTATNPTIPLEHLTLLVKPLTKEELVVEADAWRDLLKENVRRFAEMRISGTVPDGGEASGAGNGGQEADAGPADEAQSRAEMTAAMLRDKERLITHLNVVVDELESKGGAVEDYRSYVSSVAGVGVNVTDITTFWTVVRSWLVAEEGGQRWIWNFVKFFTILIAFYFASSIVSGLVFRGTSRIKDVSQLLVHFLTKFVRQLILVLGLIVSLAALEVNISPLLAAVGAAGFVIGFALQDTLSNFASGLLILAYRPFDVGDVIDAAGVSGKVDSVTLFSTHVLTFDNKLMIVPNNDIWGGTITNASARGTRRVDLVFGIGYDDDVEQARGILAQLVSDHELILDDPETVIQLNELADSSVNFICRPWTKSGDYWTVYWDLTRQVKSAFDAAGISIPFPQRDIHVHQSSTPTDGDE